MNGSDSSLRPTRSASGAGAWPTAWYIYLVRVKTSITLPSDLLKIIDRIDSNRSAFIERASRDYVARLKKAERDERDIKIINANSEGLNAEAIDVLEYQSIP